ncbi:hypothetical protein ACOME3_010105 [Neoechinorhynchus agilis]
MSHLFHRVGRFNKESIFILKWQYMPEGSKARVCLQLSIVGLRDTVYGVDDPGFPSQNEKSFGVL